MAEVRTKSARNQSMECFKLAAALLVVFIHVKFPGDAGMLVTALARVAVPMFFAISGFFSYQVTGKRLYKRLGNAGKLYAVAVLCALVTGVLITCCEGGYLRDYLYGYIPGTKHLATAMLLQETIFPYTGFTWYLIGLGLCYLVLIVYTGFFGEAAVDYRPLYIVSTMLLILCLLMGEMAIAADMRVHYTLYRNGVFVGIPMFTLGIFIRQYQEQIFKNYHLTAGKLAGLILLGILMTLLQWKGIGVGELPPGVVVQTVGLMLLLSSHPDLGLPKLAQCCGSISAVVYLTHFPLISVYETWILPLVPLNEYREDWLRPLAVAAMSVAAGLLWWGISGLWKKRK